MMNATDYEAAKDDASASVPAITPALTPAEENLIDVPAALPEEDSPAPPEPTAALHSSDDEAAETDPAAEPESESAAGAGFRHFGFCAELMRGIEEAGFQTPTPIQEKAIPELMAGRDLIGQALTGTGKTAAFGLPAMEKLRGTSGLQLLVLVPTRELAAQVSSELFKLGRYTGLHTAAFTGGQSYTRQERMLSKGINALVATPGRLIDLIELGHFREVNPSFIVVDEADEMLDMGFLDDVKRIFSEFPGPRQTMLFSATMPRPVVALAQSILHDPVEITTAVHESTNNDIEQLFYVIEDSERTNAIIRLIDAEDVGKAMIFCRTREETDSLNILLGGRGYNVNCLHGDMEQAQRNRVMAAFRRGEIDILVATDVAARGLDVDDVTHVFNFHMPFDSRGYVHRIGRTGRAGKTGTAITLVTPREMRQLESIKRTVGAQLEHRLVPTRSEVTSQRLKRIFHALHDYELDIDLLNQVQTLAVNQDVLVLLTKLLKHQLSGGADQGPERIGVDGQRLSRLLEPRPRESRSSSRGGRPMSRRGGGGASQRYRREDSRAPFGRRPGRQEADATAVPIADAKPASVDAASPNAEVKPPAREAVSENPASPESAASVAAQPWWERAAAEPASPERKERPERRGRLRDERSDFGGRREDRPRRNRDDRGGFGGAAASDREERPYRGRDKRGDFGGGRGEERPRGSGSGGGASPQEKRGKADTRAGKTSGKKSKSKKFKATDSPPKTSDSGGSAWYLN
ncbi:MAG: DEAD/DEAH box helicase [Lentisphaerae bacterium]|nr:DEAD/DEAH box helicase [Lentisphaerota bacterium]